MTSITKEHRYDLDWLRVLGVLLLVPFHVAWTIHSDSVKLSHRRGSFLSTKHMMKLRNMEPNGFFCVRLYGEQHD
jgi:peptidoglycan/LPS O-acetylase OafA/YrhL